MKKFLAIVLALSLLGICTAFGESEYPEHLVVEISMWELDQFGNDAVGQAINDRFNVEIVPVLQEWSDYENIFRMKAAADELPDCFAGYCLTQSWYADFIRDGMIRTIPWEMIEKYENIKAVCEGCLEWRLSRQIYGDIYNIPRLYSAKHLVTGNRDAMYYRADWAEKLGYTETPTDMETLYNMLYDFAHKDPDGNGEDDTYGMVGSIAGMYWGFNAFPTMWVKSESGESIPGYLDHDSMLAALTWLRNAYENKVIDPEFSTDVSKWTQGTFGAYFTGIGAWGVHRTIAEQFGGANPDLGDPFDLIKIANAFSAAPNGEPTKGPYEDTCATVFAYDTTDEEMDRLLAIYDWLLSEEGDNLRYRGIENEDYVVNEDGSYTKITDEKLRTKYPSIYIQNWPSWDQDFTMAVDGDPDVDPRAKQMTIESRKICNAAWNEETSKLDMLAYYAMTEEKQDFMFNYNAELTNIITGTEDVEAMYDAFVQKAYDAGVQEVIDSINDYIKTF